ncbi:MAG: pseudaminic acid cytidylyltransferase [Holophaga sp.]|nr:pseudaminic acid cytidylyltransferase [Holophaga sp.]
MTTVAIIPARGGSKRVPKKNIRTFCGKPMVHWAIAAARASGVFDRILCSTDSEEIAAVANVCGAETPFTRPAELSGDMTMTAPVVVHALEWLRHESALPASFCCIYPTAPFLRPEYLRQGLEMLSETGANCVFSATRFDYPVWRGLKLGQEGRAAMLWPENEYARSQDLPEAFHDAGQFYWGNTAQFLAQGRLFANAVPLMLPRHLVQDIDTPEDWTRAEFMFQALRAAGEL